jgi:enediyne polyketide synthase
MKYVESEMVPSCRWVFSEEHNQKFFEYFFKPTFKEASYLSRNVYYTFFMYWTGKARELALEPIGKDLANDFSSGDWGMVTNWAEVNIYADVDSYDLVCARFNVGHVYDSVIPLRCDFFVKKEGQQDELIVASVTQETSWVKVISHARVMPAPFPSYLETYLNDKRQKLKTTQDSKANQGYQIESKDTPTIYQYQRKPGKRAYFAEQSYQTCLEDANLVGNIYYATYFVWQGRVFQYFLYQYLPEILTGIALNGELVLLRSRLDYLRDAMPFDQVRVCAGISRLSKKQIDIDFDFYRILPDGSDEKLAVSQATYAWRINKQGCELVDMPDSVLDVLSQSLG